MKKDWHELISQPKHEVAQEKNVFVPMRDGVQLAVDIYRPKAKGKFPALLGLCPYGKELQALQLPPQPLDKSAIWDGNIEAGDTEYVVSRGYAHVIGDLRGTGDSEGEYVGLHSKKEGEDGHDLVEWLAQQPWCDGNVGMIGYSYFGDIQQHVAIEQPAHLKAIFPTGVFSDLYRDISHPGGVLSLFLYGLWDGRLGTSGLAPRRAVSAMMKNLPADEFKNRIKEALANPDIRNFPNLYHLLNYPLKNPLFVDLLLNPYDGPFYWERSAYRSFDKFKIPVYSVGAWSHFSFTGPQWDLYKGVNVPKKIMMKPPGYPTRPWREDLDVLIRWYDHWLKGIDTGIMDEPPIKIFVMGVNEWRYEEEWPLPGLHPTKFYLRSWEGLSLEPESYQDEPDAFLQQPLHVSSQRGSLKYLTAPLPEDTEVIGDVAVYLFASIDTDDTNWIVKLSDVDQNGKEQWLMSGCLKASHRALDASKSTPLRPYHPHTRSESAVSGQIYEYAIGLQPIANVFKAGHRIQLQIQSLMSPRDPDQSLHYHPWLCSSWTTVHKIYRDKKHRSHVLLPIIQRKER
jgi:predicted acyl esterase